MAPRRRAVAAAVAAAAVVCSAAGATAYVATHRSTTRPALTVAELTAYQDGVLVPLREGGRVVEQEMKPTVSDLAGGRIAAKEFASRSDVWAGDLAQIRVDVGAVVPPAPLRPASAGFDRALARYVDAAHAFRTAALAPAARRRAALAAAYAVATDADHAYDAASAVIQQWRRRLGLGATSDFPDPTPTPSERN